MSRRTSIAVVTVALYACGGATVEAATAPGAPPAGIALIACSTGKQAADRAAIFRGSMAQVPAGQSMRMSFHLGERVGRGIWRGVSAPGLDVWRASQPGVARFAYRQKVDALQKGTAYRVHVTFQWLDKDGARVAERVLRSKPCRQRGALPNLHPRGGVTVTPGPTTDTFRYVVQVRNTGFAVARGVEVRLRIDGAELDVRSIGALRSRQARTVTFVGPACRRTVTVEADPRDRVRELTESDNVTESVCPPPGSPVPAGS